MKIYIPLLALTICIICLSGCFGPSVDSDRSMENMISSIRKNAGKEADEFNARTLVREQLRDSIVYLSENNPQEAISFINSHLVNTDTDEWDKRELHLMKGYVFKNMGYFSLALIEFDLAGNLPSQRVAKAEVYMINKKYDKALVELEMAADYNFDFKWNIGNLHEVMGKRDSAITYYNSLYQRDSITYKFCQDRIIELSDPNTELYKELVIQKRPRMVIFMKGLD